MQEILLPPVPDSVYARYVFLREAPRKAIAQGVLPAIAVALSDYAILDSALNDPDSTEFGTYQAAVKTFHDARIAVVAPYIAQLQALFAEIQTIARGIDAASIADGGDSIFNT